MRRAAWGMLYTDDAGVVSKPAAGLLAIMMAVIVTVPEAAGLTVSEKKTATMACIYEHQTRKPWPHRSSAGQRYKQTVLARLSYLGGVIHEKKAELSLEIDRSDGSSVSCGHASKKGFGPDLYDRTTASLRLKVRMLKAKVMMRPCCTDV